MQGPKRTVCGRLCISFSVGQGHWLLWARHSHRTRTHAIRRFWEGLLTERGEDPEFLL